MNLIDTYISEVGRRLPKKARADIEAEIRSTLEDMLEDRSGKTGRPVDDELTVEILREYGSPEKVAATYLPERYLVGPQLFPNFMLVIRIVLSILGVLALIGMGIRLARPGLTLLDAINIIARAFGEFFQSSIGGLGYILIIFAIIEWALMSEKGHGDVKKPSISKEWDPRSLAKILPLDRVKPVDTILEMVFTVAAIVIFNFNPQMIGFTPSLNSVVETGSWASVTFVPILSEAFLRFVPALTVLWTVTIILDIVLLLQGYWNKTTRLISIGMKSISIFIASLMLTGPSLIVTSGELAARLGDPATAAFLVNLFNQVARVGLVLTIIFGIVEIIKTAYQLITSKPFPITLPD